MNAVRIPMGISTVDAVLETQSTSVSRPAPMNIEDGKDRLASFETIIREMCGTIRPTQPILPAMATLLAVMTVAQTMAIRRINTLRGGGGATA